MYKVSYNIFNRIGLILLLIAVLSVVVSGQTKLVTIYGYVKDENSNLPLKGVNISILNTPFGTSTDSLGHYTLVVKPGEYKVNFSYVGYRPLLKEISVSRQKQNLQLNIYMIPGVYQINGVTVRANRDFNIHNLDSLKAKDIQNMPNLYSDVIRSVKILPGVTSNNELSSTYNVRGGNFDQNLIYLNGYEIYQPYLVQQGIEESQSIINENLVSNLEFYNGGFPVEFGDKMSSVLAVNYKIDQNPVLTGEVNADLFNVGLTLHDKLGGFSWATAFRYAYPSLFTKTLQTVGNYKPRFNDFQFLGSYDFLSNYKIQLLFITARNNFDLIPQSWFGNFQTSYLDVKQVTLDFNGNSSYKYSSNILGLKLITPISYNSSLTTSLAYYSDKESYNKNLSYNVYYSDDAYNPQDNMQYLETGYELADNSLNINRFELKSDYSLSYELQTFKAGIAFRYSKMNSSIDESTNYIGSDSVLNASSLANTKLNTNFNFISAYIEDNIFFNNRINANVGLRALKYYFNGQFLLSPRASISYKPDASNLISLAWGFYYQPPYFYETRDKSLSTAKSLVAQKDVQYDISWKKHFQHNTSFTAELYYRDLSRLIPYYIDQLDLIYGDKNNYKGFAYGLDLQYKGELVPGMETWIGYSYLNAQEKETPGNYKYERSPLDQAHTIRIFLQDRAKSHPNYQAHVRLLLGTGYLYHPMTSEPGTTSGSYSVVPNYNKTEEYPFYFRVDMGLTFEFKIDNLKNLILTAEVFNVFNQYNITSYSWYHVFPQTTQPVPIPNILSKRYFNVGFKLNF